MDKKQLDHSIQNQSEDKKLDNITLSDGTTKLVDLLLAMSGCNVFSEFLPNLADVNAIVPPDSPFWPGCTVLHLAVMKGTKFWVELLEKSDPQKPVDNPTEEDEIKYKNRIHLCLNSSCSVMIKNAEGVTPIHLSFKLCENQITDLLLSSCDDNLIEQDQISFFHIACATGNGDVVKRLFDKGADLESQTSISFEWFTKCCSQESMSDPITVPVNSTALHIAAMCQNKEIVELLIDIGANIYAQNTLGLTPIHLSMVLCDMFDHSNCKVIAQLLLKKAPNLVEVVSNSGLSHLHVAAYADDANAIEKLLQMGSDIDKVFKIDEPELSHLAPYANKTPLLVAAHKSSEKAVVTLINCGADIFQQTFDVATTLQILVKKYDCDLEVICCIKDKLNRMSKAVDVNGTTPLHIACHTFDFEWAKELLENGADANAQIFEDKVVCGWKGYAPMHVVINSIFEKDNEDRQKIDNLVKLLIEYRANPLILSHDGQSSLLFAHDFARDHSYGDDYYGMDEKSAVYLPIADMLLKNQPTYQINPVNSHGFSHFHYACMRNEVDIVEKFLDNGIDINHTASVELPGLGLVDIDLDAEDFTPLHFAMYYQSVEVACLLIERGANVNAESKSGDTPLHIAFISGLADLHLFDVLLRHGANINSADSIEPPIFYFFWYVHDITHDQVKFLKSHGCLVDLMKKGRHLIGYAMKNAKPCDRRAIFEELIDSFDMQNAAQNNYSLIQDIVNISQEGELNLSFYFTHILRFIDMGCKIDQQDKEGETALHKANLYSNIEAIEALLLLGAEVNIIDKENRPPIGKYWYFNSEREAPASKMLAGHVWKMKFAGLKVHALCETAMLKIHEKFPLDENYKSQCKEEFDKLAKENIGQYLTLQRFLHDSSAIIKYPTMPLIQREYLDQLFANLDNLRQNFPQFSGLLTMQYRKALDRLKLHNVAMDLLPSVLQVDMPYLCLENVLKYFDNDELKYFVEEHEDPVSDNVETQDLI